MIVRRLDTDLLLITQLDHSMLAGRIMNAWPADGFPARPTRDRVLDATGQHDLGWQIVDAAPRIDPETGTPYDVVNAPLDIRQGAFPRAVDHFAPHDPYTAALIAQHAATVYRRFAAAPEWAWFFQSMESRRDELLATQEVSLETFREDYAIVGAGDRWSLVFCNGWLEPHVMGSYRALLHSTAAPREPARADADSDVNINVNVNINANVVDGGWLEITPDPFDGAKVPLAVPAWRVPARRYASDADLRDTIARAPIVHLTGVAAGTPPAARA